LPAHHSAESAGGNPAGGLLLLSESLSSANVIATTLKLKPSRPLMIGTTV
jgi:hypothetical protein